MIPNIYFVFKTHEIIHCHVQNTQLFNKSTSKSLNLWNPNSNPKQTLMFNTLNPTKLHEILFLIHHSYSKYIDLYSCTRYHNIEHQKFQDLKASRFGHHYSTIYTILINLNLPFPPLKHPNNYRSMHFKS